MTFYSAELKSLSHYLLSVTPARSLVVGPSVSLKSCGPWVLEGSGNTLLEHGL